MLVKNKKELITSGRRKKLVELMERGIVSVMPERLLSAFLEYNRKEDVLKIKAKPYNLSNRRIFVVGAGKAAGRMAEVLEKILGGERITDGIVIDKKEDWQTKKIKVLKGSHPLPARQNIEGAKEMLALKEKWKIGREDLVFCLISGGGSALLALPQRGIKLIEVKKATALLIKSGADIREINTVRKHISGVKGGRLGKFFAPAKVISFIISDVIGDDLESIASGPTYPDSTTFKEAVSVLKRYNLEKEMPRSIMEFLKKGERGEIEETPKRLTNCANYIIGNNKLLLRELKKGAGEMGLKVLVKRKPLLGETQEAAWKIADEIKRGKYKGVDILIAGGETAPRVSRNSGKGGRCQHFALSTIAAFWEFKMPWALISFSTDGDDFIKGIGGALVDSLSVSRAKKKKLSPFPFLKRFDSYNFLKKLGKSLIITDTTGTNVADAAVYFLT
jgi:glycerate-2-kinase